MKNFALISHSIPKAPLLFVNFRFLVMKQFEMQNLLDEYLGWLALEGSCSYLEHFLLTELSGKSFARLLFWNTDKSSLGLQSIFCLSMDRNHRMIFRRKVLYFRKFPSVSDFQRFYPQLDPQFPVAGWTQMHLNE